MKSLAEPRLGLIALVGAMSMTLGAPMYCTSAVAQEPPSQTNQERGAAALAAANEAMAKGQYSEAANKFAEALMYMPGNQEAINGQEQAQRMLQTGNTSQDVADSIRLQRERALAEYDAAYNSAREKLAAAQYEDATREIVGAMAMLDTRRGVLSDTEYRTLRDKGEQLQTKIDKDRETAALKAAADAQAEAQRQKEAQQKAEAARRQQQVEEALKRVRQLQMELKYDEALQVVDEVLFIDPANPSAMTLRDLIVTAQLYREYMEHVKIKNLGFSQLEVENEAALIIPRKNFTGPGPKSINAILEYPADWPQLSMRRGSVGGYQESDAERSVRQRLSETKVPIDFNGNSLEQVVAFMEQVTGLDIYVDYKALGLVGIDKDAQVNLKLQDVPMSTVLERVLDQLGEGADQPQWAIEDGILTVSSDEALRKRTVLLVYDIRDLLFQVPVFDNAPKLDLDAALNQGQQSGTGGGGGGGGFGGGGGGGGAGGGGSGTGGSIFGEAGDDPERLTRDELVQQIVNIIQENVDPEGWRDLGGDTGSLQELNGNLIITNTPNNHRAIEGLLAQLREIRALQINVEARFLTVSTDWFERIGVDLDIYFNTNNTEFNAAKSVDPNFHLSDFFNNDGTLKDPVVFGSFEQVANPLPGNPFNTVPTGAITGVPTGTPPTTITNVIGPVGSPIRNTDGFAPIGLTQNTKGLIESLADFDATSFAGLALANPALAVGIQFLDDVQVDLLIEATQADRRSVGLTAPRLTFFNGQRAWVAVTTQRAYVSSLTAVTGDASGAFQPNIRTLQDGFVLDVEGVISADRRYVTMTVIFDFSEFLGFRQSSAADFSGAAGGGSTGGIGGGNASQFQGSVELPVIRVSQVRTTVSVPDKGTVLLGGQRTVRELELETGVPVLSKIPWINRFFTNRVNSKEEQTLLILIRPEVIIQQENEDMLFPGLSDNLGGAASYLH